MEIALIHKTPTDMENNPDTVRIMDIDAPVTSGGEAHDALSAGEDGDNGDNHRRVAMATGDININININPRDDVVVDAVLSDLPEPSIHQILPHLDEYHQGREWPAGCNLVYFQDLDDQSPWRRG